MKKILIAVGAILLIFLILLYVSVSETEDEFRTCSIIGVENIEKINFEKFDSVTVAANTLYEASLLKKVMQGEQYRKAWATPITVPIAFLDTLKGGLMIIEEGGGKQTHSLELEDKNGVRYTLRSLSKDPEKLIPDIAKDLNLENLIVDGVSAQHPYAALVVARLSERVEILHTHPQLMFVPKQKSFAELNDKYGNRLYFFEYESEGKVDWTGLEGIQEILDTEDLLQLRSEKGDLVNLDHSSLIRARLFDVLIGDWDRHAKQWGWALRKSDNKFTAIPVPTDRDNAFFNLGGIVPTLIANDISHPKVQTFDADIGFLPGLVQPFDEYFLRSAKLEQFMAEATYLKENLSNRKIEEAFEYWPKAIDSLDGPEIRGKLKSRRDNILETAENFFGILQRRPKTDIDLKDSEDLELKGMLAKCFDCTDDHYKFKETQIE